MITVSVHNHLGCVAENNSSKLQANRWNGGVPPQMKGLGRLLNVSTGGGGGMSSSSSLQSLFLRLQQQQALTLLVKTNLPAVLVPHLLTAVLQGEELVLLTTSPAWATRLRFLAPKLQALLPNIASTRVVVVPIKQRPDGGVGAGASPTSPNVSANITSSGCSQGVNTVDASETNGGVGVSTTSPNGGVRVSTTSTKLPGDLVRRHPSTANLTQAHAKRVQAIAATIAEPRIKAALLRIANRVELVEPE